MTYEVRVAPSVYEEVHERFGASRTAGASASEYDFVSGPLAAAVFAFREFDELSFDVVPSVRSYTVVDPAFGPVVFVGVRLVEGVVEIAGFGDDPDYWGSIQDDPE